MAEPALLAAWKFDGNGGGAPLSWPQLHAKELPKKQLCWVHLHADMPETRQWLEQHSGLEPSTIDALLAQETRPRVAELEDGALIILRGVNLNENAEPEDMVSIRAYVDKYRIISVRKRRLKAVIDLSQKLEQGAGPKDAGEWVYRLALGLCDRMEPTLTLLNEQVDDAENAVLENPDTSLRQQIVDIRKQAIVFRRYLAPQRDALAKLRNAALPWIEEQDRRQLQEAQDRFTRFVEDLDAVRERSQIVQDELTNALADRLNRNMYLLSVIAAIFLPLGFFTGLLGINVGGIPGADNPWAFLLFCAGLGFLVLLQVLWFKKKRWF